MTPNEIDNLPAGAELNSMVADVVMRRHSTPGLWMARVSSPYFTPSSDWDDAMEAAEKCAACFEIHAPRCWDNKGDSENWSVMVIANPIDKKDHYEAPIAMFGSAPTGPLAIARAIAKIGETK